MRKSAAEVPRILLCNWSANGASGEAVWKQMRTASLWMLGLDRAQRAPARREEPLALGGPVSK